LFAVASPLGKAPTAALFALETLAGVLHYSRGIRQTPERAEGAQLQAALLTTESRWQERVSEDGGLRGLDATMAAVLLGNGHAAVAHLGDCRAHLARRDDFVRRTTDHTLRDANQPQVLLRGIGLNSNPDVVSWNVQPGDIFLLTGGVHEVIAEAELFELLTANTDASRAASSMLDLAISRGAADYLTVLAFRPAERNRTPVH
jgi:serine/threonine protein phosphatase PrpC